MEDFRKNDPQFIGFVPKTAGEAIDLFQRMKRLGLRPEHFPEAFVWCTRELNDEEGGKFEDYLVNPQGLSSAELLQGSDPEQEKIRLKLLAEAERRDLEDAMRLARIDEENDEKAPQQISPLEEEQKTMKDPEPLVFDMDDDLTNAPPDDDPPMTLASPR